MADWIAAARNMPSDDFWIVTGIAIAIALVGALFAFFRFKRSRLIEDLPTSRIRSAAQGHVELEGTAQLLPGEPILAPLSNRICAWWKYSIEKRESTYSNGRKQTRWRTIESGTSDEMFELTDDTGACVIDPEGASVIPNKKISWYGHSHRPARAPNKTQWFGFGRYRYKEERIEPGSEIYALGWFRTDGGVAHEFDEKSEVRDLLSEWKQDKQKMLKEFDADGDGMVDMEEWEAARKAAIEAVRAQQLERATDPDIHVMCKPPRRLSFILSTVSQHDLIKRSRWQAVAGLIGFFAGGSVAIWMLTARQIL